jgi:hypothetical protein
MVKIDNFTQSQPNQQTSFNQNKTQFTDNQSQTQSQFTEQNQQTQQPTQKGLISIPPALMQMVP